MMHRAYLPCIFALSSIALLSALVTTPSAQPSQQVNVPTPSAPPLEQYPEQELKEREQEQIDQATQLSKQEFEEQQKRDAERKRQEDVALQAGIRASMPAQAQPVPSSSQYPISAPMAHPISNGQLVEPAPQQYQAYANMPASRPDAIRQSAQAQPAASAGTSNPLSYTQEQLRAAWARTQPWRTYVSERLQAGWASFKTWLESWR